MFTLAHIVFATQMTSADAPAPQLQPVIDTPRVERRRSVPSDRTLRVRTIGMGVAASAFGLGWLSVRALMTPSELDTARDIDRDPSLGDGCIESCYASTAVSTMASPMLIAAAGFAGGSLHAHGRWLARNDRGLGRSKRNGRVLVGSGVALMVGSIASLGVGLGMHGQARTERGAATIRELGWWSLTALGTSGAALTGLGHGILRGHADRERQATFAVAPMLGGRIAGLSISGRF